MQACEAHESSVRGGGRVGEAGDRAQPAVARQHRKVGAAEIERRFGGAAAGPAEPHSVVVHLDPARQAEAVTGEALLDGGDHRVGGLASGRPCPRTANLAEWRAHLLEPLRRQAETTADPVLLGLLTELRGYPAPRGPGTMPPARDYAGLVVPFELATDAGVMAFFSTTTVFGTPADITLSELALECVYPANDATAEILQRGAGMRRDPDTR